MRLIVLIGFVVAVSVAGIVFVLRPGGIGVSQEPRKKEFVRPIAEGAVYRDGKTASPRVSFSSCRIEKMKKGHLTFPAFDILVLNDLTINAIPELIVPVDTKGTDGVPPLQKLRVPPQLEQWASVFIPTDRKFSGVRIDNFRLNRDGGTNGLRPFVYARFVTGSRRGGLSLKDCQIFHDDGRPESVRQAHLVYESGVCVEYTSGGRPVRSFLYPPMLK